MHYNAYDAEKNFRNVLIFCFETNILIFLLNFKFLAFKSLFRTLPISGIFMRIFLTML